jgi:8-oxo-dGTP pyrophosphatase MutT (NUDIX family)
MTEIQSTKSGVNVRCLRAALAGTVELPRPLALPARRLNLRNMYIQDTLARLRPAAVLVPLMVCEDGVHLLLTRRSDLLRHHKGQISFPGGSRDPSDSSFAATAVREASEEIGLPPALVEIIGYLDDQLVLTGYRVTPVVGIVECVFAPMLSTEEVTEIIDLPLARILAADAFETKTLNRHGASLTLREINFGRHRIWGLTARILWQLRDVLQCVS